LGPLPGLYDLSILPPVASTNRHVDVAYGGPSFASQLVLAALAGILSMMCLSCHTPASHESRETSERQFLLSMKSKCREVGERASKEWWTATAPLRAKQSVATPAEYGYNTDQDTCVFAFGSVALVGTKSYLDEYVIDSYSNKVLLHCSGETAGQVFKSSDDPMACTSWQDFEDRKDKLLGTATGLPTGPAVTVPPSHRPR